MFDLTAKRICEIRYGRVVIFSCCVVLVLSAADVRAVDFEEAKAGDKIERLLDLIHISELESEYDAVIEKYIEEYSEELRGYIRAAFPDVAGEKKKAIDMQVDMFWKEIGKSMDEVGTIRAHLKRAYAKSFTEDELDGLVTYYSSSIGQKDAKMKKSVAVEHNRIWMDRFMSQYKSQVETLFEKIAIIVKEKAKQGT